MRDVYFPQYFLVIFIQSVYEKIIDDFAQYRLNKTSIQLQKTYNCQDNELPY